MTSEKRFFGISSCRVNTKANKPDLTGINGEKGITQMKEEKQFTFLIEIKLPNNEYCTHCEQARTAQEAVDKLKVYMPDDCKVTFVYRQVDNWK